MKALKITLFVLLLFTAFVSCTKESLDEDEVLIENEEVSRAYFTGGALDD